MPLSVDRIVLNAQYAANCYVVRASEDSSGAVVVDPGGDPAPLLDELGRMETEVAGILVTHADVDHVAGLAALAETTGAEAWVPLGEAAEIRAGSLRGGYTVAPFEPEHLVAGGDTVSLGGLECDVVAVPGHSRDHVAFATAGAVFSGDLLFAGSVGRVDFEGGDWQTLLDSIRRLLDRFGPDAVVYPGHGESTTLGRELETNPFLGELRAA